PLRRFAAADAQGEGRRGGGRRRRARGAAGAGGGRKQRVRAHAAGVLKRHPAPRLPPFKPYPLGNSTGPLQCRRQTAAHKVAPEGIVVMRMPSRWLRLV